MNKLGILLLILCGCAEPSAEKAPWQNIRGRAERAFVYRGRVPSDWEKSEAPLNDLLTDTTLSLVEYSIGDVTIYVHNFPADTLEERIPPSAQVARWQRQINDPTAVTNLTNHGGFAGIYFEGHGDLKGEERTVFAWAMQLPPEHFQSLSLSPPIYRQMRADYTIKAVGPQDEMEAQRKAIHAFAQSFELIEEIPTRQ